MKLTNLLVAIGACITHVIVAAVVVFYYWKNLFYIAIAAVILMPSFYLWIYLVKIAWKEWKNNRPK